MRTVSADSSGLPREIEGLDSSDRVLWATVRLMAEKELKRVTVFEVVQRARVSRTTFNELFDTKEACLSAAYQRVIDALVSHVHRAFERPGPWPQRIRRALKACLEAFSAEPDVARMATVDIRGSAPEAQRRYRDAFERLVPMFREGRAFAGGGVDMPPDLELMTVGGTEAIIFDEVAAGRTRDLPRLLPDLLFTVLVPYIGPEAAMAEVQRADAL